MMNNKTCLSCKALLSLESFYKNKRNKKDGRESYCIKCFSAINRSYYLKNKQTDYGKKLRRKKNRTIKERLWEFISPEPNTGCWLWTGSTDRHGYARLGVNDKIETASRVVFKYLKGIDPADFSVCHTCDNPPCVNPTHLFLGTRSDNMQDMVKKGRQRKPKALKKGAE